MKKNMKKLFLLIGFVSFGLTFSQVVGEDVEINWNGTWYKGRILRINEAEGLYYVTYYGWSDSWNEWVPLSKIRGYKKNLKISKIPEKEKISSPSSQPLSINQSYSVDEKVKILWNGNWYDGKILKIDSKNNSYYVTYDGYDSKWDEWVMADRLKKKN